MKKLVLIFLGLLLVSFCVAKDYTFDEFDTDTRGVSDQTKLIEVYRDYLDNSQELSVIEMVEDIWKVMDENGLISHLNKMSMQFSRDSRYFYLLGRIETEPTKKIDLARTAIKNDRQAVHCYEMMLKTYNEYYFGTETLSVSQIEYMVNNLKKDRGFCKDLLNIDPYNRVGIAFDTNYSKYLNEQKEAKKKK
ncbi:MAG: hypothetical protein JXR56_04655 [Candidatus Cloacimonetes bacterium]|nr:hypothetical protein [Candidatus Cloacimonadota bacterium]